MGDEFKGVTQKLTLWAGFPVEGVWEADNLCLPVIYVSVSLSFSLRLSVKLILFKKKRKKKRCSTSLFTKEMY